MNDSGKTVLVVDDDEDMRAVIGAVVGRRGHAVVPAANGLEALAALSGARPIDLVVLDVAMPVMDGLETLERIRASGRREMPVVLLTAQTSGSDVRKGYAAGGDYYLEKPFTAERLLRIVDYLIGDLEPAERERVEREL